jgi:hypothetical protein
MAQIPVGSFGARIAGSAGTPRVPQGDPIGAGFQQAIGQVGNVVADNQARAEHLRRQEMAEAKQAADEADKVKALTTLNRGRDALNDLHDEIGQGVLDGSVPKDKAEATFAERSAKLLDGVGADITDPLRRDMLKADLQGAQAKLGNSVRKVVTTKNRQDVTAGIGETLEYWQRQYSTDPAKATAAAMSTIDQLAPHSTMTSEQAAKLKQKWKEDTQFTAGYEAVSKGRDSLKALEGATQLVAALPDLDPQKRAVLTDRIDAYRLHIAQKAEVAAQRAAREEERRLRKAEAAFNTFQALADKGTLLDPSYTEQVMNTTAGTPYQAGVKQAVAAATATGGLAAQPLAAQQQVLASIDAHIAQNGRTPELDRRRSAIEKVANGTAADIKADGLHAALERGVITDVAPLDFSKGPPGLVAQLQQRTPLAQRASVWAGRPVSPLMNQEAEQLRIQIEALAPKDRAGFIAGLSAGMDPQSAAGLAKQLDAHDKALGYAFAFGGMQTTAGRYTSELVLRGAQAKKDGTSTKGEKQPEVKAAQWSADIAAQLDGVFPAQTLTDNTREAALLIAHGLAAEAGGQLRKRDLERAVGFAVGGSIVEHNGRRTVVPAGLDADDFEKRLRSVTADALAAQTPGGEVVAGGTRLPVAEFVKSLPGQQLMWAGQGRYAVIVGGRPVLNAQGRPVLVGVQ